MGLLIPGQNHGNRQNPCKTEDIYIVRKAFFHRVWKKRKYTKRHKHIPETDRQGQTRKAKVERMEQDKNMKYSIHFRIFLTTDCHQVIMHPLDTKMKEQLKLYKFR